MMVHVSEQSKPSEVVLTGNLKELSWDPACSDPGSDRGSLHHLCLIFTARKREKGPFGYRCSLKRETVSAGFLLPALSQSWQNFRETLPVLSMVGKFSAARGSSAVE